MLTQRHVARATALLAGLFAHACLAQTDTFHLMQIEQAIGGLGGDATKQVVQLRMRGPLQNQVSEGCLKVYDATGSNPVMLTDFPTNVAVSFPGNPRVLIVSPGFPLPAGVTADFVMDTPIPLTYILAGKITFEDDLGGILWSLAYGGGQYTGTNLGLITNDPDGNFGPAFPGPLPLVSNRGLLFQGAGSAASSTNIQDYALTTGAATLTNNAGQSGVLGAQCYPDCNKDGTLTIADFGCFQARFVQANPGADCNADAVLTIADFGCFQGQFVGGCP